MPVRVRNECASGVGDCKTYAGSHGRATVLALGSDAFQQVNSSRITAVSPEMPSHREQRHACSCPSLAPRLLAGRCRWRPTQARVTEKICEFASAVQGRFWFLRTLVHLTSSTLTPGSCTKNCCSGTSGKRYCVHLRNSLITQQK